MNHLPRLKLAVAALVVAAVSVAALSAVAADEPAKTAKDAKDAMNDPSHEAGVADVPQMPTMRPLDGVDTPLRDTSVCLGPDGVYYLTGTTGAPTWWTTNDGIRVWKSTDLKTWEPLGMVWSLEKDATWQKRFDGAGRRAVWAPEISYINGDWWIAYSMNYDTAGTGLLKSTSGKPEGPYADVKPDGPITSGIDSSLFQDDDGTVYFVWQDGRIAKMNKAMTDIEGPTYLLWPTNYIHVGFEAAQVFKADGKYYLSCAEFTGGQDNRYDGMLASSDKLLGPYGPRYIASKSGGHNTYFKDKDGDWWSTFFGNDKAAPFRERAALLRMKFGDGRMLPMTDAELRRERTSGRGKK